ARRHMAGGEAARGSSEAARGSSDAAAQPAAAREHAYVAALLARWWHYDVVLELARALARGLAHMHAQRPPLAHRDVKPDNVVVALRGLATHEHAALQRLAQHGGGGGGVAAAQHQTPGELVLEATRLLGAARSHAASSASSSASSSACSSLESLAGDAAAAYTLRDWELPP